MAGKDSLHNDAVFTDTTESFPKAHKGVYFFGALAAVGGVSVGFDMGIIGGILGSMELFNERFLGNESERPYRSGLLVSLMFLTATIGGLSSGTLCGKRRMKQMPSPSILFLTLFFIVPPNTDGISRKYTIILASWVFALGCVFEAIGYNFALMLVGRLCVGFGQGSLTNAVPLYVSQTI